MIYLDNSATTYPKPPQVRQAVARALGELGANPGRGGYPPAMAAAVGQSRAKKILIPMNQCDILVAGVAEASVSRLLESAVEQLALVLEGRC